jgi:hypothetical protein
MLTGVPSLAFAVFPCDLVRFLRAWLLWGWCLATSKEVLAMSYVPPKDSPRASAGMVHAANAVFALNEVRTRRGEGVFLFPSLLLSPHRRSRLS